MSAPTDGRAHAVLPVKNVMWLLRDPSSGSTLSPSRPTEPYQFLYRLAWGNVRNCSVARARHSRGHLQAHTRISSHGESGLSDALPTV